MLDSVLSKQNFTRGTNSYFHVLLSCANLSSAGVRPEGTMEELQPRLPPLNFCTGQTKPSLSLYGKRHVWISQGHTFSLFPDEAILSTSNPSKEQGWRSYAGFSGPFTASMMQCWTTAAHAGVMKHILTAGSPPQCIITSLLSSSSSACSSDTPVHTGTVGLDVSSSVSSTFCLSLWS